MAQVLPGLRVPIAGDQSIGNAAGATAGVDGSNAAYGERLVVHTVDGIAKHSPERVWATISKSSYDVDEGFRDLTFQDLANAVNCVSWQNAQRFGKSDSFDVIAYLGVSDVRYAIYMFAAIKTNHVIMVPSVRNSLSQHLAVFDEAKCSIVYYTPEMEARIQELKAERPHLKAYVAENLDDLITSNSAHYPYEKTWTEARTDPIIVAHSSGSTGNPKPTAITNGVYSTYDNHRKIPPIPGRRIQSYQLLEFEDRGRFFNPFPPFHLAGLFAMTIMPVFYNCIVTLGPPEKPPSGEILSKAMKQLKIRAAWCPPTVIEQLVALPGGFEQASNLDWIMYTGGPLAPAVGDKLSKVTDVCQLYGSTETGPHIAMVPLPGNWASFEWHPLLENQMDSMGDGTFEMVVHKDPSLDWIRHLSQAYPNLDVWRTNDLFVQSPDNSKLWRFTGRRDDVIVLSNGEKFNPVYMEGTITGHPLVKGAVIIGTARFQASLIVEPTPEVTMSDGEFIDHIWPAVEAANKVGPAHGRIFRSKVVVASHDKPFKRAGKGTVIRGQTTKLYADEVEKLYGDEGVNEAGAPRLETIESLEAVNKFVRACIERLMSTSDFGNDDDIFVLGMDSLQTSELSKTLQRALQKGAPGSSGTISPSHIYDHCTTAQLSSFFFGLLNGGSAETNSESSDRTTSMASLLDKFTADLGKKKVSRSLCVAVTGTTGSLGTRLLETLLGDSNIGRIYCINRDPSARERHQKEFRSRKSKFDLNRAGSRVQFMRMTPGQANFGLSHEDWAKLVLEADAIIHNAWKVNFNHKLSSFQSQISGVRDLVDLSLSSPRQPHIFFVSSLSSVGNWPKVHGFAQEVPEKELDDFNLALPMGYGESKHVSERILTDAVTATGLNASILRVGQVAGPVAQDGGEWHKAEWLPSLIQTSKALGCLPDCMNTIEWIPVDTLSGIINEIVRHDCNTKTSSVYNLVNPHTASWDDLTTAVQEAWPSSEIKIVSWPEWLTALKSQPPDAENLPALKILDFYEGLAVDAENCKTGRLHYRTENGRSASERMKSLRPIDGAAMSTWLKQWCF